MYMRKNKKLKKYSKKVSDNIMKLIIMEEIKIEELISKSKNKCTNVGTT